jgi:pyruvate formate lyase activating enzyme
MGIHTALETNGYYGARLSDADLGMIDLVMLGLKAWDPERHRRLTGMNVALTIDLARRLAALSRPIWIRFVLVPGLTDDPEDIAQIARFAASLGNVERVEILPFHQMGRFKWERLNLTYTLDHVQPPTRESIDRTCAIFHAAGLEAY